MLSDALMLAIATEAARWFELAGIVVVVLGTLLALAQALLGALGLHRAERVPNRSDLAARFRRTLGRSILIGLELMVAADIIRTVAIEPTLDNVVVLGVIVAIRTFLSISLEVEIDGKWPWQRRAPRASADD